MCLVLLFFLFSKVEKYQLILYSSEVGRALSTPKRKVGVQSGLDVKSLILGENGEDSWTQRRQKEAPQAYGEEVTKEAVSRTLKISLLPFILVSHLT